MGKAAKWFRGLFCPSKPEPPPAVSGAKPSKRRWGLVRSRRNKRLGSPTDGGAEPSASDEVDRNKHAIAVAAAAAAEAAVAASHAAAAAQAAVAVMQLTSSGRSRTAAPGSHGFGAAPCEESAAVKIQAAFRAYLARRALRALKALVKLQALVRGHIIRKQTADMLRGIQALLRAQARARAGWGQYSESPVSSQKSAQQHRLDPATPEKSEHAISLKNAKYDSSSSSTKRSGSKDRGRLASSWHRMDERLLKSHSFTTSKDSTACHAAPSPSSCCEVQSITPIKLPHGAEEDSFCSANSSPRYYSVASSRASSSKGMAPFTPTKSNGSRGYLDRPSYMACTESWRAKFRSRSAPKQRPLYERSGSATWGPVHGTGGSRLSGLHSSFTSKAYPGSGRLDRLGMPVADDGYGVFAGRY